jgi:hypothetical protein
MTSFSSYVSIVTETVFVPEALSSPNTIRPEATVLVWSSKRPIPIYQFCYLKREILKGTLSNKIWVDPKTLCLKRSKVVSRLIDWMCDGIIGQADAQRIITCFNWIDDHGFSDNLYSSEDIIKLYINYSLWLIEGEGTTKGQAQKRALQNAFRLISQAALEEIGAVVDFWPLCIARSEPPPEEYLQHLSLIDKIKILRKGDSISASKHPIEKSAVVLGGHNKTVINAYQYCYKIRESLSSKRCAKRLGGVTVAPKTLCKGRLRAIEYWVDDLLNERVSSTSEKNLKKVFNWIDNHQRGNDLYECESAKLLYQDFTEHLFSELQKIGESNKNLSPEKIHHFKRCQYWLSYIIQAQLSIDQIKIQAWAPAIGLNNYLIKSDPSCRYVKPNDLIELRADAYDFAPSDIQPEKTIIRYGLGKRFVHVYKACYLDRASLSKDIPDKGSLSQCVELESLCPERVSLIKRLIQHVVTGAITVNTTMKILLVLHWIDSNQYNRHLNDHEKVKTVYIDYTNHLIHRTNQSSIKKQGRLKLSAARSHQNALANIIQLRHNIPISLIETWARYITNREINLPQPRSSENKAVLAFEIHRRFFWAYSRAIIEEHRVPIVVLFDDLGLENFILFRWDMDSYNNFTPSGVKSRWRSFACSADKFIDDWEIVKEKAEAEGIVLGNPPPEFKFLSRELRELDGVSQKRLFNRAIKHFAHMMLLKAGCNAEHLTHLDLVESFKKKVNGLTCIVADKNRPLTERQTLSIESKFIREWRQMKRLISCVSRIIGMPEPTIGLPLIPTQLQATGFRPLIYSDLYKGLKLPPIDLSLDTRTPRKIKIQTALDVSYGDIDTVAAMHSNTGETIQKHYGFKQFEDAARELSVFFNEMHRSANIRISGTPTAPIVDEGNQVPAGECTGETDSDKTYIEGIDVSRAPDLTCGSPFACLFCDKFGIRDDYESVLRLLSAKHFITYQSRHKSQSVRDHAAKFLPVIARIDEILDAYENLGEEQKRIVEKAKTAIDRGELDEFWQAQINALLDALEEDKS